MYDFHARQYDPQLGRFWGIDPMNQFPSGYTGMGNDPANMIDPSGMFANGFMASGGNTRYGDENQDRNNPFWDGTFTRPGGNIDAEGFGAFMFALTPKMFRMSSPFYDEFGGGGGGSGNDVNSRRTYKDNNECYNSKSNLSWHFFISEL